MKNTIFSILTLFFVSLLSSNAQAQSISQADQKGIEANYTAFMSAFEKLDPSGLSALLTENAEQVIPEGTIVRGRNNIVASLSGYMAYLKSQPKPDKMDRQNTAMQSRYLAPDVILSTYIDETVLHFGDKTRVEKMATTVVLKKVGSQWLVDLIALTPVVEMPKN